MASNSEYIQILKYNSAISLSLSRHTNDPSDGGALHFIMYKRPTNLHTVTASFHAVTSITASIRLAIESDLVKPIAKLHILKHKRLDQ